VSGKLPKFEAAIVVPTGGYAVNLADGDGSRSVTMPAGTYFWRTGTTTLLAALKTMLDAGAGVTYTVTLDDASDTSTGQLTITASSGTVVITWTSTALRDILGFADTADSGAGSSVTSEHHVRGLWLPSTHWTSDDPYPSRGDADSDPQEFGRPTRDYLFAEAPSGVSRVVEGSTRYGARFVFSPLWGRKFRRVSEVYRNESLESFFAQLGGQRFRVHTSRDDNTNYWTMRFRDTSQLRGTNMTPPSVGPYSLWTVGPYDAVKYVAT
jgi:hypothetical protein